MGIAAQICKPNTGAEAGGLQIQSKLFPIFKKKNQKLQQRVYTF